MDENRARGRGRDSTYNYQDVDRKPRLDAEGGHSSYHREDRGYRPKYEDERKPRYGGDDGGYRSERDRDRDRDRDRRYPSNGNGSNGGHSSSSRGRSDSRYPSNNGNGNGNGYNPPEIRKRSPEEPTESTSQGYTSHPNPTPKPSRPREPDEQSDMRGSKRPRTDGPSGSGGDGGGGDRPPGRRNKYESEMVHSKPESLKTKRGQSGEVIRLQANYFALLRKPEWQLYQYRVDFTPECAMERIRYRLIGQQKELLGGYIFDKQNLLYLTRKIRNSDEPVEVQSSDREGNQYTVLFRLVAKVSMDTKESLQTLNLILKKAMKGLKLQQIGRNCFDAAAKINIDQYEIQLWPGYQTSIRQHEKNILVCADITNKVMRMETVYKIMSKLSHERNFHELFSKEVLGMTVLTDYNNETYTISDVDFTTTPASTFEGKEGPVSYLDYYQTRWKIRIHDPRQPMLIAQTKMKQKRAGKSDLILLVPELCRITGLSEDMRKNFQVMRAMADYTRSAPRARIGKLLDFNKRLNQTPESSQTFREWDFVLDNKLIEFDGRVLENQCIIIGDNKESSGQRFDWTNQLRNKMHVCVPLQRWAYIFPQRSGREANSFLQTVQDAARGMQFPISRPKILTLHDDRNHSYINAIDSCIPDDLQLLMFVVPNNNADRYANIKKKCCVEHSIPTQVLVQRTITPKGGNPRSLMSVATKVAIQINTKLGGCPWMVEIPLKGLMTIGLDIARDSKNRNLTHAALVATMDLKLKQTFFSTVTSHGSGEELSSDLALSAAKAIKEFKRLHTALPLRILVYRDGVGEGQTQYVFEHEVRQLREQLEAIYLSEGHSEYKLCFVVVSKRINTRIFARGDNPVSGTIVDDTITLPERYDFYLVSQSVRQGTVSPTSYNILYDSMGLPPDRLQQLTYKHCHLYYNWSGTTRVPAVCQYAHKLAALVGQYTHQTPQNGLENKLYYL